MINDKAPDKSMAEPILSTKQLCQAIGRHPSYVSACARAGYAPVAYNMHLKSELLTWLAEHRDFRTAQAYPSKRARVVKPQSLQAKMIEMNRRILLGTLANKGKK